MARESNRTSVDGSRRGGAARVVLLVCVTATLSLCFSECFLRLAWRNPYRAETPDYLVRVRVQHGNVDRVIDRSLLEMEPRTVRMRTDARGYILPSFQHADPDVTIAFLGGSTTACNVVREELRFHAVVSDLLGERGILANTLNASRSGNTVHDSLNVLLNHLELDRPDYAVLMNATNDSGILTWQTDYRVRMSRPVGPAALGRWSLQWLSSRSSLLAFVRQAATGVAQERPAAVAERKNDPDHRKALAAPYRARIRAFVHLARDLGIRPVLMTQPLSSSTNQLTPDWANQGNQDRFNAIIREVAADEGVALIDLVQRLQETTPRWNEPDFVFYDGMHVTDAGSRIYGSIIAEEIERLLAVDGLPNRAAAP